jgi:hypothetical protein
MAKQTYTSGQVLSAAQMTTLQANDYNQTVSAKVASYTLVAADAGTRITMSNAAATTITVNTGLFAAGDTLFITNIGAGATTLTAGTATVSTISSLTLAQYDSGVLYFTSTGVAVWQKYAGSVAAGGGMTSIATGTLSGNSVSITSIPADYNRLYIELINPTSDVANRSLSMTFNSDTGTNYQTRSLNGTATTVVYNDAAFITLQTTPTAANSYALTGWITNYKNAASYKLAQFNSGNSGSGGLNQIWTKYESNTAITSIQFTCEATYVLTGGTYTIWGEK